MKYGERDMKIGMKGEDVEELQIRLSGFSGGLPDGGFGPGTEKMVKQFQKDFMKVEPTGIADENVRKAIERLIDYYSINMESLKCTCGTDPKYKNWPNPTCNGFGLGQDKGVYAENSFKVEVNHQYEYPGIHRSILWASRAIRFYRPDITFIYTSGYRCKQRNIQKKRNSTNHMGKAIDLDIVGNLNGKTDLQVCNEIRKLGEEKCNTQIKWNKPNLKAFEPETIAPTWIHWDVREFPAKCLEDRFFCKTEKELNGERVYLQVKNWKNP